MAGSTTASKVHRLQVIVIAGGLIVFPFAAALWCALRDALPPPARVADPLARLIFSLQRCCVAILFCFATGIAVIGHERLHPGGIDPRSGNQSRRITFNLNYLQQTLEQLVLAGLAGLRDMLFWPMTHTEPRRCCLQPVAPARQFDQPIVAKCEIATFPRYNTLRSFSDPTTIHGDEGAGFVGAGATGALPMGCL